MYQLYIIAGLPTPLRCFNFNADNMKATVDNKFSWNNYVTKSCIGNIMLGDSKCKTIKMLGC
jgi:hypothetical protein